MGIPAAYCEVNVREVGRSQAPRKTFEEAEIDRGKIENADLFFFFVCVCVCVRVLIALKPRAQYSNNMVTATIREFSEQQHQQLIALHMYIVFRNESSILECLNPLCWLTLSPAISILDKYKKLEVKIHVK